MSNQEALGAEIEAMRERVFGKRTEEASEPLVEPTIVAEETVTVQPEFQSSDEFKAEDTSSQFAADDGLDETPEKKKYTDWKNRYKTYKASTDSTIHQLRRENVSLSESNISLSKRVETLQEQVNSTSNAVDIYKDLFSEEETDVVGDSTLAVIKRANAAAVEAAVKPLKEALEEERKARVQSVEHNSKASANSLHEDFLERLEELAPEYTKYDRDSGFHDWMQQPDEYSGVIRSDLFYNAKSIGDAKRVALFFHEYAEKISDRTKSLDSNITPTKSSAGTVQPTQKTNDIPITRRYVDWFYDQCIRGGYDGKEKERQEIERKIKLALASGKLK